MKQYLKHHPWKIIEEGFSPEYNRNSESVFSLGNGKMGQRANFEEFYSGDSMEGSYVAGIYYPDKTKVGWWKNGYPEYFAKVLNATNWIGLDILVDGVQLDLHTATVSNFRRELDMQNGYLLRSFELELSNGHQIGVEAKRFCSMADPENGALRYAIKALNFSGNLQVTSFLDADVENEDSNYDEKFWEEVDKGFVAEVAWVTVRTKKTAFDLCTGMTHHLEIDGNPVVGDWQNASQLKQVSRTCAVHLDQGQTLTIFKYAAILSSENHAKADMMAQCVASTTAAAAKGFDAMLAEQAEAWAHKWEQSDVAIGGDTAAQQGIRFNIFQLHQTYTGEDERLNIGPKGFTGEKYGGSTYWDTEAYCLPFYLSTADQKVARNLLRYRYKHLEKAIENAAKLGFTDGAALYPMVTMNGEECHNEWEITFEEIHRNGAIAYAIYDYIGYTGDWEYMAEYGLEVLIAISRFWAQRVNWSTDKEQYVMLGVTGPNEYENNVNNNWYTNKIASWTLSYALEGMEYALMKKVSFRGEEATKWQHIMDKMYYPYDEKQGMIMQQDGFLDKEHVLVQDLDPKHLPLNQNWSWDRILRSVYIKQADVLQGLYFFEDEFDMETHRCTYDYYETRTVHESSLSPCVHAILAAKIGRPDKAYEFYLRTARLDLDDYNNDTEDGCHITSMAGSWMSIVKGFAGMRVRDGKLRFQPFIPQQWESYAFKIGHRGDLFRVEVTQQSVKVHNESDHEVSVGLYGDEVVVAGNGSAEVVLQTNASIESA
ncbi:UNVERIFIED_CONTAM: hypothetical protein GTU68_057467 [Idotea baltica]|nr:hypothetical protein [Idotea baltica]